MEPKEKKQRQEGHTRAVLAVQCSDFLFVKFVLIKEDGLIKSKGKSEREGEPIDVKCSSFECFGIKV